MSEARALCLRWLAQREHSRAELVQKLRGKGFDKAAVDEALDGLAQEGLQNDGRCLEVFVRGQFAKGHGPRKIRQQAYIKGMAGAALEECLVGYDWDAAMERVHGKKFGGQAPATPKEFAARARFLSQRGFEPNSIQALLRRLGRGGDEFNF